MEKIKLTGYGHSCRPDNIAVRKEWGDMSRELRMEYIDAVKCLGTIPSRIDPQLAPGARNRYDDFVAAHIMMTLKVHATALFLPWHRHFLQLYETALREECGYSGYQPYWDISKYAHLPFHANPLIDGSKTSMSGNGAYVPNRNATTRIAPIPVPHPRTWLCDPGTGGGYVERGPFVDWEVHLGPVVPLNVRNGVPVKPNPRHDALGFNPRRLIRDFNNTILINSHTYEIVNNMLVNMTDIHTFHPYLYATPHGEPHNFISCYDNDVFDAPVDPLFFFLHSQIDRLWTIWQALDFETREYALDGTLTIQNTPPSRNGTLDDMMYFAFDKPISIGERMSPTKNGLCYIYE
ncbi:hypothetical protein E4U21_006637 [Claviceps maximensis]|nr:hypothetical protein E4U21_006637 [Claviceps maximensis]